jgi:hypothetical protein
VYQKLKSFLKILVILFLLYNSFYHFYLAFRCGKIKINVNMKKDKYQNSLKIGAIYIWTFLINVITGNL